MYKTGQTIYRQLAIDWWILSAASNGVGLSAIVTVSSVGLDGDNSSSILPDILRNLFKQATEIRCFETSAAIDSSRHNDIKDWLEKEEFVIEGSSLYVSGISSPAFDNTNNELILMAAALTL